MPSPTIPIKLCVNNNDVHNSYSSIAMDIAGYSQLADQLMGIYIEYDYL